MGGKRTPREASRSREERESPKESRITKNRISSIKQVIIEIIPYQRHF